LNKTNGEAVGEIINLKNKRYLMNSWPELFKEFFRIIDKPLGEVFCAEGLREMWLQGEFYRYFKPQYDSFRINHSLNNSRIKHDLYSEQPTKMIAEIKVYGWDFQGKNLDGSSIKKYSEEVSKSNNGRLYFDKARIDNLTGMGEGVYLSDVRRLHNINQQIEKYMILILKKRIAPNPDDEFGRVIKSVQVSDLEYDLDLPDLLFFVRISRL
jgi:hypothetical protein